MTRALKHALCALTLAVAPWMAMASDSTVSLVFAGDVVLDDAPGAMIAAGGDPFASLPPFFKSADLRIANLECVVATTGTAAGKNFTFRAHPRTLPVLKRHFDAVSVANNHTGDFGREAFAEMLAEIKTYPTIYLQISANHHQGLHNLQFL